MSSRKPKIPVIVGPTASGKTELSIQLASACHGEIVSADSRQIYKWLDIGTAKPSASQLEDIPHHCIGFVDPSIEYNAGAYAKHAIHKIEDIRTRNHIPVIVGGSGLYIRALVDGMFEGEVKDETVRMRLKNRVELEGLESLYNELKQCDPVSAEAIHPNNAPRILRALEICQITGKTRAQIWEEKGPGRAFDPIFFGLYWPREILYQRINDRVDRMLEQGLVDEVHALVKRGYGPQNNSMNTLGYKEVISYLNREINQDAMREQIQRNTRRFAKRQMTWFRNDARIHWIPLHQQPDSGRMVRYIVQCISSQ